MRRILVMLGTLGLLGAMVTPAAAHEPPRMETEPVSWHAQADPEGTVDGAWARLRSWVGRAPAPGRTLVERHHRSMRGDGSADVAGHAGRPQGPPTVHEELEGT